MKQERPVNFLENFLPPGTYPQVADFFKSQTIHLSITHQRRSVLGDYRHPNKENPFHRISINANLNPFSFLITLLHELAHLYTFIHFGNKAAPHGNEWKTQFRHILIPFLGKQFFPADVEKSLLAYLHDPAASTCTDPVLFKALYRYDVHKEGYKLVDDFSVKQIFEASDGHTYQVLEKLRTRTRCRNLENGKTYYFQGIVEVKEMVTKQKKQEN